MHVLNFLLLAASAATAVLAAPATDRCSKPCPQTLVAVCASNGKTYAGECEIEIDACRTRNPNLFPAHALGCTPEQQARRDGCYERCPQTLVAVCASNGKTFAGECEIRVEACRTRNPNLFPAHALGCTPEQQARRDGCYEKCPQTIAPVCGVDGKTYASDCEVRVAACRTRNPELFVAHAGRCTKEQQLNGDGCYRRCPQSFAACEIDVEACRTRNPGLTKAYTGYCGQRIEADEVPTTTAEAVVPTATQA
ncbi:hypothetical protein HDU96_003098 [Phlyctochytrium bullatum]|nr:hypothetical protein HDU96_003098 [Phlyctochytrium bullatum]